MVKKLILLAIILVVILASSLGYLYTKRTKSPEVLDPSDVKTCQTDADCGWYQSVADAGQSVICGNLNAPNNSQTPIVAGNPPKNSICTCTNNICRSGTFTLPNNSPVQK